MLLTTSRATDILDWQKEPRTFPTKFAAAWVFQRSSEEIAELTAEMARVIADQLMALDRSDKEHAWLLYNLTSRSAAVASAQLFQNPAASWREAEQKTRLFYWSMIADFSTDFVEKLPPSIGIVKGMKLNNILSAYQSTAGRTLKLAGFSQCPIYSDSFGDIVVDFVRGDDRITFAVDEACVQILSHVGGRFDELSISEPLLAMVEAHEHIKSLLAEGTSGLEA